MLNSLIEVDVVIYSDLLEDFSRSLSEFHDTLAIKIQSKDPLRVSLVQDARIFTFLRASQVLKTLVWSLHKENSENYYKTDIESALFSLYMFDMLDEDVIEKLHKQFDLADFFAMDRAWLDSQEDRRIFEGGLCELNSYCRSMNILLHYISTQCELITRPEQTHEVH